MSNYCQRFKDANNVQTTKSDATSVVFLLGKVCRENSFLSFSPFFSCQDKAVLFLPLLSLSPSPLSFSQVFILCSTLQSHHHKHDFQPAIIHSLWINLLLLFLISLSQDWPGWELPKDSNRTPSSRAPMRTVSQCQHPTISLCQSTLSSSSDGNTRKLPTCQQTRHRVSHSS